MVKVTSQRAINIQKVSDLKESVESSGDKTIWLIDNEEFTYQKGDGFIKSRTGIGSPREIWPLDGNTRKSAKAKIFELITHVTQQPQI